MHNGDYTTLLFRRRKLPHWLVAEAWFFVTIRLKGSLPKQAAERLREEREVLLKRTPPWSEEMRTLLRRQFTIIDGILDNAEHGHHWLKEPAIADVVVANLPWLCKSGWDLQAVVLSNHLHLLMKNVQGRTKCLIDDLGKFKSYTGREANKILGREGAFWMAENFDHWCRGTEKIEAVRQYIRNNPVKAGLVVSAEDWPWHFSGTGEAVP